MSAGTKILPGASNASKSHTGAGHHKSSKKTLHPGTTTEGRRFPEAHLHIMQPGVEWVEDDFGHCYPEWTTVPKAHKIEEEIATKLGNHQEVKAEFLGEGTFHKVWKISTHSASQNYVVRVALPVDATNKTKSEVATMQWVKEKGLIPVAEVIAYDASYNNKIGYEYLLLSYVPGTSLLEKFSHLDMSAKEGIAKKIAEYVRNTYDNRMSHGKIGNLYPNKGEGQVGEIVSMFFLQGGKHFEHSAARGPYSSSHDYLQAKLALREKEFREITMRGFENRILIPGVWQRERDDVGAKRTLEIIHGLRPHLEKELPASGTGEPTMLYHGDLSMGNIIVDESGKLEAVMDWECVSFVPLWKACQLPDFLQSDDRNEKPDKNNYGNDRTTGKFTRIYGEHMEEYELTQLRELFKREVGSGWWREHEQGKMKRQYDYAIRHCDDTLVQGKILRWIAKLDHGEEHPIIGKKSAPAG